MSSVIYNRDLVNKLSYISDTFKVCPYYVLYKKLDNLKNKPLNSEEHFFVRLAEEFIDHSSRTEELRSYFRYGIVPIYKDLEEEFNYILSAIFYLDRDNTLGDDTIEDIQNKLKEFMEKDFRPSLIKTRWLALANFISYVEKQESENPIYSRSTLSEVTMNKYRYLYLQLTQLFTIDQA